MSSAVLFALIVPLSAFAKPGASACTVATLTKDCQFFTDRAGQEFIELSDGTKYRNPFYQAGSPLKPGQAARPFGLPFDDEEAAQKALQQAFKRQVKIASLLDGTTEEFRIAMGSPMALTSIASTLISKKKGVVAEGIYGVGAVPLLLPWPPDQPDAPVKIVSYEQIRSEVIDRLPPERKKMFLDAIDDTVAAEEEIQKKIAPQSSPPPAVETPTVTPAREAHVRALVEETRTVLLEEIRRGRPLEKMSSDERAIYEKIATVKYAGIRDSNTPGVTCSATEANAMYISSKHEFVICPGLANDPDAALVQVIGHELGHAIDPCRGRFPVYRLKMENFEKKRDLILSESDKSQERWDFTEALESGQTSLIAGGPPPEENDDTYKWIKKHDLVEKVTDGFVNEPTKKVSECLIEQEGMRAISKDDVKTLAREMARQAAETKTLGISQQAYEKKIYDLGIKYPQCLILAGGPSQLGEAIADIWGAKALGRHLEKHPPKTEDEKIGAFSLWATRACEMKNAKTQAEKWTLFSPQTVMDSHPYERERLDSIILKDPRVQRALGCAVRPMENCGRFVGTASGSAGSSGEGPSHATGGRK